eukprot:scaffold4780_cov120-Isochrysis_galbana.AAC.4
MPNGAGNWLFPKEPENGAEGFVLATSSPECANQSNRSGHPSQAITSESMKASKSSLEASSAEMRRSHPRSVP